MNPAELDQCYEAERQRAEAERQLMMELKWHIISKAMTVS